MPLPLPSGRMRDGTESQNHAADLQVLPKLFARQDYGIALPPGTELREELNRQILRIIADPDWARMLEGYLGRED